MRKTKKKNYVIVALVALLIALAVGYAAYSSTISINTTVTNTGVWDVKFESVRLLDSEGNVTTEHGSAEITTGNVEGDTINVDLGLKCPGDGVIVEATIANNGNLPATVTDFMIAGITDGDYDIDSDEDVTVEIATPNPNEVLQPGAKCTIQYVVKWNADSKLTSLDRDFSITFVYEQDKIDLEFSPVHTDTPAESEDEGA